MVMSGDGTDPPLMRVPVTWTVSSWVAVASLPPGTTASAEASASSGADSCATAAWVNNDAATATARRLRAMPLLSPRCPGDFCRPRQSPAAPRLATSKWRGTSRSRPPTTVPLSFDMQHLRLLVGNPGARWRSTTRDHRSRELQPSVLGHPLTTFYVAPTQTLRNT